MSPQQHAQPLRAQHHAAIYARVSSDQQAQNGTIDGPSKGHLSQLAAVQAYASEHRLQIDPDLIFADNGSSGTTLARPKLDALRDAAAAGQVDQILVLSPDRLARKYAHQLMLIEEFKKLGVEITFVNRPIAASPEDQLLLQIQGVIAEYEREQIVERHGPSNGHFRRGKLHKAQLGQVCVLSGAPYGYVYMPATDAQAARYEIHEREAAVVNWWLSTTVLAKSPAHSRAKRCRHAAIRGIGSGLSFGRCCVILPTKDKLPIARPKWLTAHG